jgi:hypothetical protein
MPAGEALNRTVLPPLDQGLGCGNAVLMQHVFERLEALLFVNDFKSHVTLPLTTHHIHYHYEESKREFVARASSP